MFGFRRAIHGEADFLAFYAAGSMANRGESGDLFNIGKVFSVEQEIRGRAGGSILPFVHPAFEAVFFRPLAILSYQLAYLIFLAINLCCLAISLYVLYPPSAWCSNLWAALIPLLFLFFTPVGICLLQGQDTILLLMLLAIAYRLLRADREGLAGIVLGLGTFRFQLVLPIAMLYLIWKKWRVVGGFIASAVLAATMSIGVAGLDSIRAYPALLRQISLGLSSGAESISLSVWPEQMPNIRGLFSLLFSHTMSHSAVQVLVIAASVSLWVWATVRKLPFESCVVVAFLTGYHGNLHDCALLLIPLASAWKDFPSIPTSALLSWSLVALFPALCFSAAIPISLFAVVISVFLGISHFTGIATGGVIGWVPESHRSNSL